MTWTPAPNAIPRPYPHPDNVEHYRKQLRYYVKQYRGQQRQQAVGWTPTDEGFYRRMIRVCWREYQAAMALRFRTPN